MEINMKKLFLISTSLLFLIAANLNADDYTYDVPSWYSEEVTVTESEITRKNADGQWVPFIDKTFSACATVKISDAIQSLEQARDEGEKAASAKLDAYLKKNKETKALESKYKLSNWKYNDSLQNGCAYVKVEAKVSIEKQKPVVQAVDYKQSISEANTLARILQYDSDRLTLVDTLNLSSMESMEAHRLRYTNNSSNAIVPKGKSALYYPDGTMIYDTVINIGNCDTIFNLKNIVKGRKTVIIIRADVNTDAEKLVITYKNKNYTASIKKDSKNRWRNLIFEVEEGTLTEYSPEFTIKSAKMNIGTISIYQLL